MNLTAPCFIAIICIYCKYYNIHQNYLIISWKTFVSQNLKLKILSDLYLSLFYKRNIYVHTIQRQIILLMTSASAFMLQTWQALHTVILNLHFYRLKILHDKHATSFANPFTYWHVQLKDANMTVLHRQTIQQISISECVNVGNLLPEAWSLNWQLRFVGRWVETSRLQRC